MLGVLVGLELGSLVGLAVGTNVGLELVGELEGAAVGVLVGSELVGLDVGLPVGWEEDGVRCVIRRGIIRVLKPAHGGIRSCGESGQDCWLWPS